jgi:hypothetical protein
MANRDFKVDYYRDAITGGLHQRLDFIEQKLSIQNAGTDNAAVVGFEDFLFSGLNFTGQGPNSPTQKTFKDDIELPAFVGTGTKVEEGWFTIHLTHKLAANTNMTVHLHLTHNVASPSGNIKFYVDVMYARGYLGTYGTQVTLSTTVTPATQYEHIITPDDDMTIVANTTFSDPLEVDGVLLGRVYRDPADAADTFANDVFLIQSDIHFSVGQFTTTERNRPFTNEGF